MSDTRVGAKPADNFFVSSECGPDHSNLFIQEKEDSSGERKSEFSSMVGNTQFGSFGDAKLAAAEKHSSA